jgi:hypothetical protein
MSFVAGNFQDHYAVLGIEPDATSEVVQAAYSALARKWHPNNEQTGDREKFNAVNQAYEVLVDPIARAAFDSVRGGRGEAAPARFSGKRFFEGLEQFVACRMALLTILYDRRWTKPRTPGLSVRELESLLAVGAEQLQFTVWYLKQKGLIAADDKSNLSITVQGMDVVEAEPPRLEVIEGILKPSC